MTATTLTMSLQLPPGRPVVHRHRRLPAHPPRPRVGCESAAEPKKSRPRPKPAWRPISAPRCRENPHRHRVSGRLRLRPHRDTEVYVNGNPLNLNDPTGHSVSCLGECTNEQQQVIGGIAVKQVQAQLGPHPALASNNQTTSTLNMSSVTPPSPLAVSQLQQAVTPCVAEGGDGGFDFSNLGFAGCVDANLSEEGLYAWNNPAAQNGGVIRLPSGLVLDINPNNSYLPTVLNTNLWIDSSGKVHPVVGTIGQQTNQCEGPSGAICPVTSYQVLKNGSAVRVYGWEYDGGSSGACGGAGAGISIGVKFGIGVGYSAARFSCLRDPSLVSTWAA